MGVRKAFAAGDDDCNAGAPARIIFEFLEMGMVATVLMAVMEAVVVGVRVRWCWW